MQVLANLHAVDFHGRVWAYLYQEADALTLIDTGIAGDVKLILDAIAEIGRDAADLTKIILTHCHRDHAGTLAELQRLCDAPALAHRLDAPVVRGETEPPAPVLSEPEKAIFDAIAGTIPDAPPATVHRELDDGDEIDLDGGAQVIHVPGHTPGSIAVYVPRTRTLFTGDAVASVNGRPLTGFFNADPDQARESVRRLAELDIETGCFGHGLPLTKGASRALRRLVSET